MVPARVVIISLVCLFARRRFQLYDHQRQSVHEHHHIAANGFIFHHAPLIADLELIPQRAVEVDELHQCRARTSAVVILHLHAALQVVRQRLVSLLQRTFVHVRYHSVRLLQHLLRQLRIHSPQSAPQVGSVIGFAIVALHVVAALIAVAQLLEQSYQRLLIVVFGEVCFGHIYCL